MPDLVISHLAGRGATVTLNQPGKRNPISPAMRAALVGALETLRKNDAVRSVTLTGAGSAFCSGMDLADLAAGGNSYEDDLADSKSIRDFYDYILSYPKPTIAAVNGPAVAGGAGLALVCDATILSEKASFCFSEVRLGFVPAIVGVHLQLSIGIKRARDLMLSARTVLPLEALQMGLCGAVVAPDQLNAECARRAGQFDKNGPEAMAATKKLMAAQLKHNCLHDMNLAVELNSRARQSSECKEGVGSFLSKREASWV